jgi:hypothetical protein
MDYSGFRGYTGENVPILKRLTVWSLERSIEVCLLGALFGYLVSLGAKDASMPLNKAWVFGIAVAVFLPSLPPISAYSIRPLDVRMVCGPQLGSTIAMYSRATWANVALVSGGMYVPASRTISKSRTR